MLVAFFAPLALVSACGPHPARPDYSGLYSVTPSPAAQTCGSTELTFTAQFVYMIEVSNGTAMTSEWDWFLNPGISLLDGPSGPLEGDHFEQTWTMRQTVGLACPATGAPRIVTTSENHWTGVFRHGTFESVLTQTLDDDCGIVTNCVVSWELTGAAY